MSVEKKLVETKKMECKRMGNVRKKRCIWRKKMRCG